MTECTCGSGLPVGSVWHLSDCPRATKEDRTTRTFALTPRERDIIYRSLVVFSQTRSSVEMDELKRKFR